MSSSYKYDLNTSLDERCGHLLFKNGLLLNPGTDYVMTEAIYAGSSVIFPEELQDKDSLCLYSEGYVIRYSAIAVVGRVVLKEIEQ
jgi:hypothetical protein